MKQAYFSFKKPMKDWFPISYEISIFVRLKQLIYLLLFIFSGWTINTSCTASKENKIEQTWQLLDISNIYPENVFELWEFRGGKFYAFKYTNDSIITTDSITKGWYQVKAGLSSSSVTIQGCNVARFNDKWDIKKLKKDVMILMGTKDNQFVYKEFVKFPK